MAAGRSAALPFGRPARDEGSGRIPVVAVTGFLGAGKTTLIRSLLGRPEGANTAIIVNEFGEVGIDQDLLQATKDTTVLLGNGCLCCSMRSDLQETLRDLWIRRSRRQIPAFQRVIIETTGLADPGPILQTFLTDRALAGEFFLQKLICVVALVDLEGCLADMPDAAKQIVLADCIVETKADLLTPLEAQAAREAISAINPLAERLAALDGSVDPSALLSSTLTSRCGSELSARAEGHLHDIGSFVLWLDEPVDWPAFASALETIRSLRGGDLLRLKGLVNVRGRPGPLVVQMVRHLAHPPIELAAWPASDRRTRLVTIARGMTAADLRGLFDAAQRLAAHQL